MSKTPSADRAREVLHRQGVRISQTMLHDAVIRAMLAFASQSDAAPTAAAGEGVVRRALIEAQGALQKAADQFAFYADEHAKKGTPEGDAKGATNMAWARSLARVDHAARAALATPQPESGEGGRWSPMSTPPRVGGHYAVGGYIHDGVMPRRFERAFATCILTLDGPSWSHCDDRKAHVPLQYWQDLGAHPEAAPITPDHASPPVDVAGVVEALRPFAELGDCFVGDEADDLDLYAPPLHEHQMRVRVGWLRAARDAYAALDRLTASPTESAENAG